MTLYKLFHIERKDGGYLQKHCWYSNLNHNNRIYPCFNISTRFMVLPGSEFEVLTWLWIWGPWGRSSGHCPVGSECPILFGFLLCVKFSRTFSSSHQLCLYFLCHNPTRWYFIHLLYMFNFNFLPINGYLVQIATSPSPSFLSSFLKYKSWTPPPPPWCTYKLSSCSCGFSALSCFINLYKYVYVGYM